MMTSMKRRSGQVTTASLKPSYRKLGLPLILAFAALLLTACGWQGTGIVTDKTHTDGYWYTTMMCSAYDAKGNCTLMLPQQNYVPDYWYVDVTDSSGAKHSVSVEQGYWNGVKTGDSFDNRDKK